MPLHEQILDLIASHPNIQLARICAKLERPRQRASVQAALAELRREGVVEHLAGAGYWLVVPHEKHEAVQSGYVPSGFIKPVPIERLMARR
jgi:hypothetical protein